MALYPLTGIGLCAGVGWLDLAVKFAWEYHGRDYRTVAFCERDAYAASVLLARMADSSLEPAAICDSIEDIDERFGGVDCVVAGFPCQPWSCAGSRRGAADERWIWPDILAVAERAGTRWLFLENVPGLLGGGVEGGPLDDESEDDLRGFSLVSGSLAEAGFAAEWLCLRASDVGASHRRERWFCVAHRDEFSGLGISGLLNRQRQAQRNDIDGRNEAVGHGDITPPHARSATGGSRATTGEPSGPVADAPDAERRRLEQERRPQDGTLGDAACQRPQGFGHIRRDGGEVLPVRTSGIHLFAPGPNAPVGQPSLQTSHGSRQPSVKKSLNACFVEWLMGAPIFWTVAASIGLDAVAMASWSLKLRSLMRSCLDES